MSALKVPIMCVLCVCVSIRKSQISLLAAVKAAYVETWRLVESSCSILSLKDEKTEFQSGHTYCQYSLLLGPTAFPTMVCFHAIGILG